MAGEDQGPQRRGDDDTTPMLAYRMTALERRVDAGFRHIDDRLDTLGFVRADVYAERNVALEQRLEGMDREIVDAAKPGKWALALFASTLFAAVIGIIVQVALQVGS